MPKLHYFQKFLTIFGFMIEDRGNKTEEECTELLHNIFADKEALLNAIAPKDNLENINTHDELIQILGNAIWDIFSDNHEVIAEDDKIYNFGSFRGTGSTIADFINEHYPLSEGKLNYMDFYMGTIGISNRASLLPFYKHIFMVLKKYNCNWRYSFPKLGLVSFKQEEPENSNPADYNPLLAMQKELANEKSEVDNLQAELDKIYEHEFEEAKYKPLPLTVQAYQEIYGILPEGHPQKEFE